MDKHSLVIMTVLSATMWNERATVLINQEFFKQDIKTHTDERDTGWRTFCCTAGQQQVLKLLTSSLVTCNACNVMWCDVIDDVNDIDSINNNDNIEYVDNVIDGGGGARNVDLCPFGL